MTHRTGFGWIVTLLAAITLGVGCDQQGPAEQAGESLDNAAQDVQETLDPQGPAEETGEAVDDALGN
ncbi:hypothetical protein [Tautonia marina]|uniref:hypothetical protein n=1 Tax=Tautonia marina TaxID=2653855 RepID=UPI001260F1D0|nr:hypothetical protein [Tautonia marina]